jgi:TolA-binding protein
VGSWLATDASSELPLAFSENTRIVLRQDSRGRVEQVSRRGASFLLERGAVRAEIVRHPGADWRFLAGPFEVRVTGTALNVAWDPARDQFAVRVDNGSVVVQGPYLGADRVVRAGEVCVVDLSSRSMRLQSGAMTGMREAAGTSADSEAAASSAPQGHTAGASVADTPLSNAPPRAVVPSPSPPGWAALEQQGDHQGAYYAVQRVGPAVLYRSASADGLLDLAKIGQLSGHHELQRDALLACRRRFPSTRQSALAAYELGRASSSAEAAAWFEAYLADQPDGALAREALGRLLEAQSLAQNAAAARDVANHYLSRYPDGPHAPLARRTLAAKRGDHDD